jgi:phospholipase/carboxylesterase
MTIPQTQTMQWLPEQGEPQQLLVLLHGVGSSGAGMAPLAERLRREFPQAVILAPDGFEAFDADPSGRARQWFSVQGVTEENRAQRIAAVLPQLAAWLAQAQQNLGLSQQSTALVGFSQGAILSLALVHAHDGAAGRVLAFAGRYAQLPQSAPQFTTLHWFHGDADPVIPVSHARQAMQRLADLGADATIDIAQGVGHEINGTLLNQALHRLRSHIPHRTWAAAMGAAAAIAPQAAPQGDGNLH